MKQWIPPENRIILISFLLFSIGIFIIVVSISSTDDKVVASSTSNILKLKGNHNLDKFQNFNKADSEYLKARSETRTIGEFYDRRAYAGAPPFIPHPILDSLEKEQNCLNCHQRGGFVAKWNRYTPVTPHPNFLNCRQCHVKIITDELFVESNWIKLLPPQMGQAHLPGSPPPIPHTLQLRENCIACHAGPGAVSEIQVDHPHRSNCVQCHVKQKDVDNFKSQLGAN